MVYKIILLALIMVFSSNVQSDSIGEHHSSLGEVQLRFVREARNILDGDFPCHPDLAARSLQCPYEDIPYLCRDLESRQSICAYTPLEVEI